MRVLIVDDDELFSRSLQRSFTLEGVQTLLAHDLETARRTLVDGGCDLVVLDLLLQDNDGLELLRTWSGELPMPPTVVVSGHVDVRETVRCMRAGALCVLQKPATPGQILALLERLKTEKIPVPYHDGASFEAILGDSAAGVRSAVEKLARFRNTNVLLSGETGTGKSSVAQALHRATDATEPFIAVNCAAIPESLFESELFGSEAHAFTGAKKRRVGLLERAALGTVFLDEVAEMSPNVQPKLLRALETRQFYRVGGARPVELRARVVSATHRTQLTENPKFRADLYYRLAGFSITLSPLRERTRDIEHIALHFLWAFCARYPGTPTRFTPAALDALRGHSWPGNLRELKSVIARAAIQSSATTEVSCEVVERALAGEDFQSERGSGLRPIVRRPSSLRELERVTITEAFHASQGNVSEAARRIGLPRSTVRDKLRRYGWPDR